MEQKQADETETDKHDTSLAKEKSKNESKSVSSYGCDSSKSSVDNFAFAETQQSQNQSQMLDWIQREQLLRAEAAPTDNHDGRNASDWFAAEDPDGMRGSQILPTARKRP